MDKLETSGDRNTLFPGLRDYYLHSLYPYVKLYTLYYVPSSSQILFMIKCSFFSKKNAFYFYIFIFYKNAF